MFLPVLAELVGEKLQKIKDPNSEFPTTGHVRVHRDKAPPEFRFHDIGIWKVRESQQTNEKKEKHAKYTAFERLSETTPLEIISIRTASDATEELRKVLLEDGLAWSYRLDTHRILLECLDGTVIGPFRLERNQEDRRFRCAPNIVDRPVKAWKTKLPFLPLINVQDGSSRSFASGMSTPPAETYVDLMPLKQILSTMLKQGCKTGPGTYLLSEKQREVIVERLSSIRLPEDLLERRHKLQQVLDISITTGKAIEAFADLAINHPSIAKQLDELKASVAGSVRAELESTSNELTRQLNATREAIKQEESRLLAVQKKYLEEENKSQSIVRAFEDLTAERIREAETNMIGTLANVAVLKPFFQAETGNALVESSSESPTTRLDSTKDCIALLTENLKALGITTGNAKSLGTEIFAGIALGQWVFFQGSLASVVARTVSRSLFSEDIAAISIPIGFINQRQIDQLLKKKSATEHRSMIFEGANRSCTTAYGSGIENILAENIFHTSAKMPVVSLLGTILDGPSTLPLDASITAHGPVFDTDLLSFQHGKISPVIPGQIQNEVSLDRVPTATKPELLENLLKPFRGSPNLLWQGHVSRAFGLLEDLRRDSRLNPIESLLYGWILPRIRALGVSVQEQWDDSNSEYAGEKIEDLRVRAYLDALRSRTS